MNENLSTRFAQILGVVGLLVTLVSGLLLLQKRMSSESVAVTRSQAATHVSANADSSASLSTSKTATRPIEELRVGDRVMAFNPEVSEAERSSWKTPDWESWIKLTLLMTKPDGSELRIQMLRSEDWVMSQLGFVVDRVELKGRAGSHRLEKVDQTNEETGLVKTVLQPDISTESGPSLVPLSPVRPVFRHLAIMSALFDVNGSESGIELLGLTVQMDLHELGLTGKAIVLDIEACPPIRSGDGQLVTATFRHKSGDVIDLVIADEADQGEHETIGTTSNHPFWSVDRQEYVQAGSLRTGEHLRTIHGDTKQVVSKLARQGTEPVYNLEVFGEHTYFVGKDGVLVHNNYETTAPRRAANPWNEFQTAARGRYDPSAVRPTSLSDFYTNIFPAGRRTHVLDGDVRIINPNTGNMRAGGFHHRPNGVSPSGSRLRGRPNNRNADGVYEGYVRVEHAGPPSQWVNKNSRSTFFPDNMSRSEVMAEIYEAYQHAVHRPGTYNTFRHTNRSGLTIQLYIDPHTQVIKSAHPLY